MGMRGPGARGGLKAAQDLADATPASFPWLKGKLSRAGRVIAFIESLPVTKGILAGTKMRLLEFQKEFIRAIYDPTADDGRRRVRLALLSIGRKNGKTGLIVGIALAHLVGPEAEDRGEIGSAANDREQAALVFEEIEAIIDRTPWMQAICNVQRFKKLIEVIGLPPGGKGQGSVYEALSSDAKTKHGMSPSLWIYDELAQSQKRELLDTLSTSQGGRSEPLGIVISTQSALTNHPLSELIDYGEQVNTGVHDDPTFVCRVYASPEGCDLMDRDAWHASNPALGIFRDETDLETLAKRAQRTPSFESAFRNLYLNQRVDAVERAINRADWEACAERVELDDLKKFPCFGALDLGSTSDLTALSGYWPEPHASWTWQWVPRERIRERVETDRVPYDAWERSGDIVATPGRARDNKAIIRKLVWFVDTFDVIGIGYDRWRIEDLLKELRDEGLDRVADRLVPFGQGFKEMAPAFDEFETLLIDRKLRHGGSPVLRWQASNLIVQKDEAGNRKPDKRRSFDKIDGIVSLIMAVGVAMRTKEEKPFVSVYANRGLLVA
jgi:phage terminase large subunit-like protein